MVLAAQARQKLVIILGPTASGKTALSLDLAERFRGEIISGDSMQVYRRMDIGTAKISPAEQRGIPHHLLDIREPEQAYSVADFRAAAQALIPQIHARQRLPFLVGGTGLYLAAVTGSYYFPAEIPRDEDYRRSLQAIFAQQGGEALHRELAAADPRAAARIHPNDSRRLFRALEVYRSSGQTITALQEAGKEQDQPDYCVWKIGLSLEREWLYQRIEQRVEEMLTAGLVEEVAALLAAGVPRDAVAMQGLGYRQIAAYLAGEIPLALAVEQIKTATRRFAKRQFTWFKRDPGITWFRLEDYPEAGALTEEVSRWLGRKLEEECE